MDHEGELAALQAVIGALVRETFRLRKVMREVYYAGAGVPSDRAATVVEPLWQALQKPVDGEP